MQLDAALRSLWLHCRDVNCLDVKVLYSVSDPIHDRQYRQLMAEHPAVHFIPEYDFKGQLPACIAEYPFVLFMVDDMMFVRPFSIKECTELLNEHQDALGFSLRLGTNTHYCYSLDRFQHFPPVQAIDGRRLKWNWTMGECDFGYPLEVSSSLYRTSDLLPVIADIHFSEPNTFEAYLAAEAYRFAGCKPFIISHESTISFSNPVNKVQQVYNNRAGTSGENTIQRLSLLFEQGYRISIEAYSGFTPYACHQEVELCFRGP